MNLDLLLLLLAVLPVLLLGLFVYRKDKFQKEPLRMLLKAFFFGALSVVPAVALEGALSLFDPGLPLVSGLYNGFIVAGLSEELFKLLLLYRAVWKARDFDEYFDGIVYATFVSLGFACVENIGYVFGADSVVAAFQTGAVRAVMSVPGHFLFGVAMGYFFALAKFEPARKRAHLRNALIVPWLLHGTFDALLMVPETLGNDFVTFLTFIVFLGFDVRLWKLGMRRLKELQELSRRQNEAGLLNNLDWNV